MEAEGKAYFGVADAWAVFRFEGRVRFTMAQGLDLFIDEALDGGSFDTILVDLRGTAQIDSTGIGLLARIGSHALSCLGRRAVLVCGPGDVEQAIRAVDFDRVFDLVALPPVEPTALEEVPLDALARRSHRSQGRVVLDSHRDLMTVSDRNRQVFESVVGALEQEVSEEEAKR